MYLASFFSTDWSFLTWNAESVKTILGSVVGMLTRDGADFMGLWNMTLFSTCYL
jgi:hypothetical protein